MAVLDILTFEEAATAINAHGDIGVIEAALIAMNSGVAEQVDNLCGPVVARSVVETHHGGGTAVMLRKTPVLSVTSVVETTGVTPATLVSDDYLLEARGHYVFLHRRTAGYSSTWVAGDFNVAVTFSAGRYTTTATVSPGWKQLAASVLNAQWQQLAGVWTQRPDALDDLGGLAPFVSVEDMLNKRVPYELLGPGVG